MNTQDQKTGVQSGWHPAHAEANGECTHHQPYWGYCSGCKRHDAYWPEDESIGAKGPLEERY